jgi:mono/diheme cytochrome c family protein
MRRAIKILPGILMLALSGLAQTKKTASGPPQATTLASSKARGKTVYAEQCLSCHQVDGGGVQNMNPPLNGTKWVLGDKRTLISLVLKGMTGDMEIDGNTFHNVMAPHSNLPDQQIADVLTYIRSSFGNKARAVTLTEVKTVRETTK